MKYITRISLAVIGSIFVYFLAFEICRITGSGLFSSGPLDWLFNALLTPGAYLADFLSIKSEQFIILICWGIYAPFLIFLIYFGIQTIQKSYRATRLAEQDAAANP